MLYNLVNTDKETPYANVLYFFYLFHNISISYCYFAKSAGYFCEGYSYKNRSVYRTIERTVSALYCNFDAITMIISITVQIMQPYI